MSATVAGPSASQGSANQQGKRRRQDEDEADHLELQEAEFDEEDAVLLDGDDEAGEQAESSHTTASGSKGGKKKRKPVPGVIYISRVPPGMTPQKIKYLMGRWGDVGKLYAQKRGAPTSTASGHSNKKQKHTQALYSEAWVQFLDKNVAKTVAEMLNAEIIGGKKGDRYRDDIWTMKYLSGFKWEMLGEQVAYERQAHTARLRNEVSQSRAEQSEYLKNVELARVLDKRKAKKEATGAPAAPSNAGGTEDRAKGERSYRQREPAKAKGEGMDGLMSSVFG